MPDSQKFSGLYLWGPTKTLPWILWDTQMHIQFHGEFIGFKDRF